MTTAAEVRAAAARLVVRVAREGRSLDAAFAETPVAASDRGLLRMLGYGTVRWYLGLVPLLQRLLSRPASSLDPQVHALCLVGLFQLLHTDIPAHAAVMETVGATRALGEPRASGLVNAVLRRLQREGAGEEGDLAVATAHPGWLVTRIARDWPDVARTVLDANNQHPPFWLRVNARHQDRDAYREVLAQQGIVAEAHDFARDALHLPQALDVHSLPGFAEGWVSVQDAAAQLAADVVGAEPGDRVLDACAAPGGKACHLLERTADLDLVAVDVSAARLDRMRDNLARLRLAATLVAGDAERPEDWWDGRAFDRVLLDVPCSATGVIRRHPDIKLLRRDADIAVLAGRQRRLLDKLWPLVAPGGRLVYASCSVLDAENAEVVRAFLASEPGAWDATAAHWPGSRADERDPGVRIRPGDSRMDGFYYACLTKVGTLTA